MQRDDTTGERTLEILLNGVSTRRYERVIPEMADTVGVDLEGRKHVLALREGATENAQAA